MNIPQKYLVFLGDVETDLNAKTGFGLVTGAPRACVGQMRLPSCQVSLGIPDMTPAQAVAAGAQTLVIGVAPVGGSIQPGWIGSIVAAIEAGLNMASGMHTRLGSVPEIADAARRAGRSLFDVRHSDRKFPVGTGRKRSGKRVLTVGTDCAIGKKYTALSIDRAMQQRGMKVDLPRDGPDRNPDFGRRRCDRCGGGGLHRRSCRMALARQRCGSLGRHRRSGLAVPSRLCRGQYRTAPWLTT